MLALRATLRGKLERIDGDPAAPAAGKEEAPPQLTDAERAAALANLKAAQAELTALQGEAPLILSTAEADEFTAALPAILDEVSR